MFLMYKLAMQLFGYLTGSVLNLLSQSIRIFVYKSQFSAPDFKQSLRNDKENLGV